MTNIDAVVVGPRASFRLCSSLTLMLFGLCSVAASQDPFALQRDIQKTLKDEASTKTEIERIRGLKVSSSQTLLTKDLDQAQGYIDSYSNYIESGNSAKQNKNGLQAKKAGAQNAVSDLVKLSANCKKSPDFDGIDKSLISLRSYFGYDPTFGFFSQSTPSDPDEAEAMAKMQKILAMDGRAYCKDLSENGGNVERTRQAISKSLDIAAKQAEASRSDFDAKAPRAQQVLAAWIDRKGQLEKALEQQTGTASTVANYLPYIMLGFCIFALLIFVILMKFPERPQMELIASGQVIQFATVMVLLIVVCMLGMAKFIADSTLGTLLGGISGYVLSQGVGRQERHSAGKGDALGQNGDGNNKVK